MEEEELKFPTFKEHVQTRSMWIGSNLLSENLHWIIDNDSGHFIKKKIFISDALLKTFDEILVNAIDQYVRSPNFEQEIGGPVSLISIQFNEKNGEISISNNGKGIPVYYVKELNQYSVQAIISREYSGSNFDDKKNPDRVVGGVNGLGIKLININSSRFEIETVDYKRKLYYRQVCRDNMDIIEEPVIIEIKDSKGKLTQEQKSPHTTIRFIPDYAKLCRETNDAPNQEWINNENLGNFKKIIETRIYQTAAFISCINYRYENDIKIEYKKKAKIYFNGKEVKINNLSEFAKLFGVEEFIEFEMSEATKSQNEETIIKFPWRVCIGYAPNKELSGLGLSIINGVFLPKGGSHTNMLYNQIGTSLIENIDAVIKNSNVEFKNDGAKISAIKKMLFMIDVRQIPLPQFAGQTKDSITVSTKDLNLMKKIYIIPDKVSNKIWKMIKDAFEYKILQQDISKSSKKKRISKIRKYERAEKLGINSGLFIPEGDTAAKPIRDIITSKKSPVNKKNHGMYNIQGVPPNTCKKTKEILIDGELKIKQDKDLQNNLALQGLATVLNLDYNNTYYYGPDKEKRKQGDKEFSTLNYGYIIIATDQDLDGIGNICSLIVVYILVFWPDLIKRGFVKRLQTPLVRVYMPGKKGEVFEFYSIKEYQEWVVKNYGLEENMPENIRKGVNYYKGLGGHTPEEVRNMGENIHNNIITLTWDKATNIKMKLFYGQDTGERKDVLLTPVSTEYSDEMMDTLKIPVSTHFEVESKSFQLYFMKRKLKNAVDGLIPSQRKAMAGARIMFRKESKAKVYQVTGYITKKMHYQHGDMSMNETITKMAQNFTGSNNIPIFIPISNHFGDRVNGRGITGSPRYIDTKYNAKVMDLIFPPEDDWLLEYVYEDGNQAEPKYYVPIIPYSILETSTTTGVGWKIDVWARDYDWVMFNLRQMIKFNYPEQTYGENNKIIGSPLSLFKKVWVKTGMKVFIGKTNSGKIVSEICRGEYMLDEKKETIIITQLPLKIWSYNFKCSLLGINPKTGKTEDKDGIPYCSKKYVDDVIDNTGNDINEIIVKLKPGSLEKIQKEYGTPHLDPIEDYLNLYQVMTPHLNMIGVDESVKEFQTYEEIMEYWFIIRKEIYIKRLERQIVLLELRIQYYSEILRFIYMDEKKEINIDKKKKEEREKILLNSNFIKFNKTNLLTPKYIKTEELPAYILKYGASYKYIDDINKGMTEEEYIMDLENKIQKMKDELERLKSTTWKDIWIQELDKLDVIIKEGIETNWLFDIKQHQFKKAKK